MQFPAELADEVHPHGIDRRRTDHDIAGGQPAERLVREVGAGHPRQQLPGLRAHQHQHPDRTRQRGELHRPVPRHVLAKVVVIQSLPGAGRHQVEGIVRLAPDRELRVHAAVAVQGVRQAQPPDLPGHAVGDEPVQEVFRARSRYPALGECGHVEQADVAGDVVDFPANRLEPARTAERPVVLPGHPVGGEEVGPFPAEQLSEHGAAGLHALVAGRGAQRARGGALLVRVMDDEDVGVGFLVLLYQVVPGGVFPETARLDPEHVDGRLALDDPLGQLPAGAACGRDAEAVPLGQPEIVEAPRRTDDRVAVRRIGDGAVEDFLDPDFGERRHPRHRGFDVRHEAVDVFLEEFVLGRRIRSIDVAAGRILFVGSQDESAVFLAQVP